MACIVLMIEMSTEKGHDTREHLSEVALGLFLKYGYDNVSLTNIASQASVSKGGLTYHFQSKTEILQSAIQFFFKKITTSTSDQSSPDSFDEFVHGMFKMVTQINEMLFQLTGIESEDLNYQRLFLDAKKNLKHLDLMQMYYGPAIQGMNLMLEHFKETESLAKDVDSELLAFHIMSVIEGSYVLAFFDDKATVDDHLSNLADDFIRRYSR